MSTGDEHDVTLLGALVPDVVRIPRAECGEVAVIAASVRDPKDVRIGDTVTLADAYLVPQVYNARRFGVPLDGYPTIESVDAHCAALPAFAAAHPDRQPDAPEAT